MKCNGLWVQRVADTLVNMGFRWQLWQPCVCNMRLTSVPTWALWWRHCNLFWLWGPHSRQNMEVNRIALFWSPLICCAVCIDCKQILVLLHVGEKGNISCLCMQLPFASNSCVPTHRQTLVRIWCQFALYGLYHLARLILVWWWVFRFRLTMTLLHNGNIHGLLIRQRQPLQELFSGANVESTGSFQFAVLKICLGGNLFHYFCAILFTW